MPTTNSRQLTLIRQEGNEVKILVTYKAEFNTIERHLAGLGMKFIERIAVIGVDPPGATTGTVLKSFPGEFISVPPGVGTHSATRNRHIIVSRADLDEDAHPLLAPDVDADEIRCRIRIEAVGLPPAVTPDAFTDEEVLGGVFQPSTDAQTKSSA